MPERIPPFTLSGEPANDDAVSMKTVRPRVPDVSPGPEGVLDELFMRIGSEDGVVGEPIHIGLTPDGQADLSGVPAEMREKWEKGIIDDGGLSPVLPKQGVAFLAVLLLTGNVKGVTFSRKKY